MKPALPFISLLGLTLCSATTLRASVTVAWKVPAEIFRSHFDAAHQARKLAQPPGASAFIQPGDELWDISAVLAARASITLPAGNDLSDPFSPSSEEHPAKENPTREVLAPPWAGDWVVWDARSEMIIARGTRNEVLAVERQLRLKEDRPLQIRTKLELVAHHPESTRSVSLVSSSSENASIEVNGWETHITAISSPSISVTDLELTTTWPGPEKDSVWELKTAAVFPDGERTLVARQGDCEIWATVTTEGIDGTPLSKIRWIEKGDSTEPWTPRHQDREGFVESLDSDRSIGWFPEAGRRIDVADIKALMATALIDSPPELHSRVHGRFFDFRPFLTAKKSPLAAPGSFAGYDPLAETIVLVSSAAAIDSIKDNLEDQGSFCPPSNISIETNPAAGNWFILGRSGETQSLTLKKGEEEMLVFQVEPTITSSNELLDLSYKLKTPSPAPSSTLLESSVLLPRDKLTRVGEFKPLTGDSQQIEITARWQEVYR